MLPLGNSHLNPIDTLLLPQRAIPSPYQPLPQHPQGSLQPLRQEISTIQRIALQALDEGTGRPATHQPNRRLL